MSEATHWLRLAKPVSREGDEYVFWCDMDGWPGGVMMATEDVAQAMWREHIREDNDGGWTWRERYLSEPLPPLPPGVYCWFCPHGGEPYVTNRCGRYECRAEHPGCPERDCPCIAHMTRTIAVESDRKETP